MAYWPGMNPAAVEGQVATSGVWDKFSNLMFQPQTWQALGAVGEALGQAGNGGEGTSFAKALNQGYVQPTAKGQIARQYGEAKKKEQVKLSDALSGNLSDIASDPNVLGASVKPDGSFSLKFKDPGKDQTGAIIKAQQAQGGPVAPIAPTTQSQPQAQAPTASPYGFRGAAEAQAGTDAANAGGGRFSDAFANPSTSSSGASGLGLSPEELLATEANAREYVAQPVTNAYNMRLSDQLALGTAQKREQGLIPVDINGRKVMMTPKELIDWENTVMDYNSSLEQSRNMAGWRADQLHAMEPVRQAQVDVNSARAEEVRQKADREKAIEEMLQKRGDQKVPGTDYTYREAHRLGILDNLEANAQAIRIQEQKEAQRKEELALEGHRKMIADMSDPYNPKSLPKAKAAADAWLKQSYPDVAKKYLGGVQQGDEVQLVPKGAYKSKDDVKAAFESGKITKSQALQILRSEFGGK